MKNIFKILGTPIVLFLIVATSSCTKENATAPADELASGEVAYKQPDSGLYKIARFLDQGDDESALFNGYTFEFQPDGDLIATLPDGQVVNGTWTLNAAETVMSIDISGTGALNNLDADNWRVVQITDTRIRLRKSGPDVVVFVMI